MQRPLLLSIFAVVPVLSSIFSSSQDSQLMHLLQTSRTADGGYPEWILQPTSKTVKKYDRNCFFSPVQCMLSFNQPSSDDPILFTTKIKRYFYRK